ncbi:hypothetical protein [Sinanaerobacter chloroacetimidivorans]|jgi:hypothetical protein|nr:hypothetical protein [Sinanaerobacter chloroacetimidivorans]
MGKKKNKDLKNSRKNNTQCSSTNNLRDVNEDVRDIRKNFKIGLS